MSNFRLPKTDIQCDVQFIFEQREDVLRVYIFQQVRSIHIDFLRERSLKWNEVECKPYLLAGYNYFQLLKEYYKRTKENNKKWYHKLIAYPLESDRTIYHTLKTAVRYDRLEIIKYFMDQYKLYDFIEKLMNESVINGKSKIFHYLDQLLISIGRIHSYVSNMVSAPLGKNIELLQWLTEKISKHNIEDNTTIYPKTMILDAIANAVIVGRIDMIEYLMAKCNFTTIPDKIRPFILENGIMSGSIEMVEWILAHGVCYRPLVFINYIEFSAKYGHLNLVQYFESNNISHFTSKTIENAVRSNNLQLVEWLHRNHGELFTTLAMDLSAKMGISFVKWFHSNRTEGCTIQSMINASFNHDLETVKWLRENRSDSYNCRILNQIIVNSNRSSYEILQYLYDQNLYVKFDINQQKLEDICYKCASKDRCEDILNFMIDHQNQLFSALDLKKAFRKVDKRLGLY
ncbi:hypothetical protein PPL_00299 [Heterostelium album PN500]|uniref:Ankyrin repeat protein n=1 Tax=Heterostelium pallidum (strain ATCC 26659 / Pp 5 / PN500) TaxID=670386 RepID=D3AW32_HETP5|nr:hypothetical protein PPL_00299 [Heterostelium album PN500]EFA86505.1 hypothetical protein PPL_00299 [Heterostelium album PN500]|eukprot:XP_020438610.1 hypothetical protein PPL_00299 [Heterostelium album PN500]